MTNLTPSQKRRDDKIALRTKLLTELARKPRTTMQLASILEIDRQAVYQAMLHLEQEGKVSSFNDRRNTVTGAPGLVWSLAGEPSPPPPQDPLLWSMFGGRP